MASRYDNKITVFNSNPQYEHLIKAHDKRFIKQFKTAKMKHPTARQIMGLETMGHIWVMGDRFYKLADHHYGDPELWWIIAWFNQKPTEGHLELGDAIQIPFPLERVMDMFEV